METNPIKALDIFEALALGCIPENGTLASAFYEDPDSLRYEITEYKGLINASLSGRSVILEAAYMSQASMSISAGKIISTETRNLNNYRTPEQKGRNFSFVFFPDTETEVRIRKFTEKLLRYREAKK